MVLIFHKQRLPANVRDKALEDITLDDINVSAVHIYSANVIAVADKGRAIILKNSFKTTGVVSMKHLMNTVQLNMRLFEST